MCSPARPLAAIVLGAAIRPDGTASPTLHLRVSHAAALHRAGRADLICTTGGPGRHGPPEAHVARDLALSLGIPPSAVLVEDRSTNTCENIRNALRLIPPDATPLIVSNRWHLPRAWMIARLLGRSARVSGPRGTAPTLYTARAILREGAALPNSAIRAWRMRASFRSADRTEL